MTTSRHSARDTTGQPAPAQAGSEATPPTQLDSSGRSIAVGLPDWDLLPPTEMLARVRPQ